MTRAELLAGPVDPGQMRHRITLQSYTATQDELGSEVKTWVDVATVWAKLSPLSIIKLAEEVASGAIVTPENIRIDIRYRAIDPSWRAVIRARVFDIHAFAYSNDMTTTAILATGGVHNG